MPRGGAKFSSAELAKVLSYYDVGIIRQAKSLTAGNRRAPKMIITSQQGKFLLKRRPKGKDDLQRVAFAHAIQTHLAHKGSPVAALVPTREDNNTVLQIDNHIYEFFKFIKGIRYDGLAEATIDAGRQLGSRLADSRFVAVSESGHHVHLDSPGRLAEEVVAFVAALEP